MKDPAHFTAAGGYECKPFAELAAQLWSMRKDAKVSIPGRKPVVHVAEDSYFNAFYWHIACYGVFQDRVAFRDAASVRALLTNLPTLVLGKDAEVATLSSLDRTLVADRVRQFPTTGESLFLVSRPPGTAPQAAISQTSGLRP
jgi:hypothetical protein